MNNYPGFDANVVRPIFFIEILLQSGPFRATSSDKNIVVDGVLYYAVGGLGKIGEYAMTNGTAATAMKLTLTGIPSDLIGEVANENTRNRPVSVGIALVDEGHKLATPLIIYFKGTIDSLSMDIGTIISVSTSASSRLINWARSVNSRYTNEDQQSKYPDDKGFQFIADIMNTKLMWGG